MLEIFFDKFLGSGIFKIKYLQFRSLNKNSVSFSSLNQSLEHILKVLRLFLKNCRILKVDFQGTQLKIACAIQLICSADLQAVITSARNNIFSWDQKHLIDIGLFYQKYPKCRFLKNFMKIPRGLPSKALTNVVYASIRHDRLFNLPVTKVTHPKMVQRIINGKIFSYAEQ